MSVYYYLKMKKPRPKKLNSVTFEIPTGYYKKDLYLTISEDSNGTPFEVFAFIGKSGQQVTADAEAVGRMVSLCLRCNIPVEAIIKELIDIDGGRTTNWDGKLIKSIPDAIGQVLKERYLNDRT